MQDNQIIQVDLWQSVPQSTDFITDVYMKRVAADPKLRDFANNAK